MVSGEHEPRLPILVHDMSPGVTRRGTYDEIDSAAIDVVTVVEPDVRWTKGYVAFVGFEREIGDRPREIRCAGFE